MISLSIVAIPVFLDTDTDSAQLVRHWAHLYRYGGLYMPALSVTATGLYAYAALRNRASDRKQWILYAAAGATTIAMVPFTLLMMAPVNNTLLRLEASASASVATVSVVGLGSVKELVVRWAWLHAIRSVFPLIGGILGLVGVLREVGG